MYRVLDQQGIASDLQSQKNDIPEGCDLFSIQEEVLLTRLEFFLPI